MKGSILIYGGKKGTREQLATDILYTLELDNIKSNLDVHIVETLPKKKSIGIGQIKDLKTFINQKPFSGSNKGSIIYNADRLTVPAQNALLKTLEETPSYATVILLSKNLKSLLPTVTSRCQKIDARKAPEKIEFEMHDAENYDILYVLSLNFGERLDWAGECSKEELGDIVEILESWIFILREDLTHSNISNIEVINSIKKDLESTNVNKRLALENLVLNLK